MGSIHNGLEWGRGFGRASDEGRLGDHIFYSLGRAGPDLLMGAATGGSTIGVRSGGRVLAGEIAEGIVGRGAQGAAERGLLNEANFAQKTFKSTFSAEGRFAGRPVSDVAADLSAGRLSPSGVPIEYIVRDGNTLILNTRSAQALEQAGIPRGQWNAVNMTGNAQAEARLTGQLSRNKLTSQGTTTVRPSNGN